MSGRRAAAVVAVVLSLTGLAGCAAAPSDISVSTSELWQSMVVSVAEQAAAGDVAGASSTLDSLQSRLDLAVSSGEVSTERATRIQQTIELVRADLQPAPATSPADGSGAPVETVPSSEPAATDTPATTVDPGAGDAGSGNGNNGNNGNNGAGSGNKGNGNGNNGNGNGKNK